MGITFNEISIISPSYRRAGNIKAINIFGDKLIIACHEFEVMEYQKAYPNNEIMVLPDSTRKNMGKVRDYIYKNCRTKYLLMIDDDVAEIKYFEKGDRHKLTQEKLENFIINGFEMCEDAQTCLWGCNQTDAKQFYREFAPFSFLTPVLGPFSGHIIDKDLGYDHRLGLNEDYDFALQVLQKYHKILRFNKYHYIAGHLTQKGGCGAYRILEEEKKQAEIMIKKWGSKVVKYDFNKSTNPKINCPLKGV